MDKFKVGLETAKKMLQMAEEPFVDLFQHGSLLLEYYKPEKVDLQKPHDRDEVYIVASGRGSFFMDGDRVSFQTGDFLFAPAGKEHRFEEFSDDFATWVIFYGPKGGEIIR